MPVVINGKKYVKEAELKALSDSHNERIVRWSKIIEKSKEANKKHISDIEILQVNEQIWEGRYAELAAQKKVWKDAFTAQKASAVELDKGHRKNNEVLKRNNSVLEGNVKVWKDAYETLVKQYKTLHAKYDELKVKIESDDEDEDDDDDDESEVEGEVEDEDEDEDGESLRVAIQLSKIY